MIEEPKKEPSLEKDKFKIPDWAGKPPSGTHLDVLKSKQLLQKLLIDEKGYYYFGRNPTMCDFVVEHASCSRVHALLLYHKLLKRFAMVDLESSHGTYVENVRIEPLTPVFIDFDGTFHFGASTRRYSICRNLSGNEASKNDDSAENFVLPTEELELDNLTEYHTAQNRRIPQIPISIEEARRKNRPRPKLKFADEEDVINPEDVDPTIGRFRNLVRTAVIPSSSTSAKKRSRNEQTNELFDFYAPDSKKTSVNRRISDSEDEKNSNKSTNIGLGIFSLSTLGGMTLSAAPDLDLYSAVKHTPSKGPKSVGPVRPVDSELDPNDENHPHKKKYAKEAWPGRKPSAM